MPTVFKENIVTVKNIKKLPLGERIALLFGASLSVIVVTRCQHKPGKTEGSFRMSVGTPISEMEVVAAVNREGHPPGATPIEQKKVTKV